MAAGSWREGTPADDRGGAGVDHRAVPDRARGRSPIPASRRKGNGKKLVVKGARGNNLQDVDGGVPAGRVHLRHRRLGRRQVDADHRDPLQARRRCGCNGARQTPAPVDGDRGWSISTRSSTSTSRRSGGRRGRTRRPTRGSSRRSATGSRGCRRQGARLQAGALLLQRQGRALRGLPGRRAHQDRDALPAGRLRRPARSARAGATTARRWRSSTRARRSPTCST